MRRCYLVCYDIREPKRLRRIHKFMKAYEIGRASCRERV